MKRILTLSLLLSSSLSWSVSSVKVQNFNFNYADGKGSGTASSFEIVKNQSQVFVNRNGTDLEFSSPLLEENVVWKNAPSLILDSQVEVRGFDLNLGKNLVANLVSGQFNSDSKMSVKNVSADCSRLTGSDVFEELINGCLEKGTVKVATFVSESVDAFFANVNEDDIYPDSTTQVRSLNLTFAKKNFNLTANAKFGVNGTLKARGNTEVDYQNRKATIRITEVKFGILNITNKFFAEIKKMDIEGMRVSQPYIYFDFPVKE